jgi:site-specific recombinase XerD
LLLAAIFALGYLAGLRISEVVTLPLDHCVLNQCAGTITTVGAKGGKTRTLDLHNAARRALYAYIHQPIAASDAREPESVYVFTSQPAARRRQRQQPDHLSARAIEHLWAQLKGQASHTTWPLINAITFHDLWSRHSASARHSWRGRSHLP